MFKAYATKNDHGRTLFKFLINYLDNVPVSKIESLFRKKEIKVNGNRKVTKQQLIFENDEIIVYGINNFQKKPSNHLNDSSIQINFKKIYEDSNILIVDKKQGIAMHSEPNCLNDQVLQYLKFQKSDSFIPSSIGRIDKVTSGLVVYAKNYSALKQLKEKSNFFEKIYAFRSYFNQNNLSVEFDVKHDETKKRMIVVPDSQGQKTKTRFFIENGKQFAQIYTGKKHQIRVVLSKLNFPIHGDRKYGGKPDWRVFLHSYKVVFHNLDQEMQYLNNKEFISEIKW